MRFGLLRVLLPTFGLVACLAPAAASAAGFETDPLTIASGSLVSTSFDGTATASAPDGTASVLWTDGGAAPQSVNWRQISPNGDLGPIHSVARPGSISNLAVVPSGNNTFRAIYAYDSDLYSSTMNADGTVGSETLITPSADSADIAELSAGVSLVAWSDSSGPNSELFAQRVDTTGTIGSPALVTTRDVLFKVKASGVSGVGAALTWVDFSSSDEEIGTAQVDTAGSLNNRVDALNTIGHDVDDPAVAMAPSGTSTVTFCDCTDNTVYASSLTSSGVQSPQIPVGVGIDFVLNPQIGTDANGDSTVVWWDSDLTSAYKVRGARLSASGAVGSSFTLSELSDVTNEPELAVAPNGNAMVSWVGDVASPVSPVRATMWPAGVPPTGEVATLSDPQFSTGSLLPTVSADANADFFISWTSLNSTTNQVQTQRYVQSPVCQATPTSFSVAPSASANFNLSCQGLGPIDFNQITAPTKGALVSLSGTPANATAMYMANPGSSGSDSFVLDASNGGGHSAPLNFAVTITSPPPTPTPPKPTATCPTLKTVVSPDFPRVVRTGTRPVHPRLGVRFGAKVSAVSTLRVSLSITRRGKQISVGSMSATIGSSTSLRRLAVALNSAGKRYLRRGIQARVRFAASATPLVTGTNCKAQKVPTKTYTVTPQFINFR